MAPCRTLRPARATSDGEQLFLFNGVNNFVIVPHASDLDLVDQGTMSVWISPRGFGSASGGYARILRRMSIMI